MTAPESGVSAPLQGIGAVVPWNDFRRALAVVLPHAAKEKDRPDLNLVRVHLAGSDGQVLVSATDGFTAAIARVLTLVPSSEPDFIDVPAAAARKILAVFGPQKGDFAADMMLQLDHFDMQLAITDVSGMVNGERLVVDVSPTRWQNPDLRGLLGRAVREELGPRAETAFAFERLKRFEPAERLFEMALHFTSTVGGRSILVTAGYHFAGLIVPTGADDFDAERREWFAVDSTDAPINPEGAEKFLADLEDWRAQHSGEGAGDADDDTDHEDQTD